MGTGFELLDAMLEEPCRAEILSGVAKATRRFTDPSGPFVDLRCAHEIARLLERRCCPRELSRFGEELSCSLEFSGLVQKVGGLLVQAFPFVEIGGPLERSGIREGPGGVENEPGLKESFGRLEIVADGAQERGGAVRVARFDVGPSGHLFASYFESDLDSPIEGPCSLVALDCAVGLSGEHVLLSRSEPVADFGRTLCGAPRVSSQHFRSLDCEWSLYP